MKSNSWICSQLALYAGRERRIIIVIIIIISATSSELKNYFCSGVLFEFSLYASEGINPGMTIRI
jgi:hypothetical protein